MFKRFIKFLAALFVTQPDFKSGFASACVAVFVQRCKVTELVSQSDSYGDAFEQGQNSAANMLHKLGLYETADGSGGQSLMVLIPRSQLVDMFGEDVVTQMERQAHDVYIPQIIRGELP